MKKLLENAGIAMLFVENLIQILAPFIVMAIVLLFLLMSGTIVDQFVTLVERWCIN